MPAAIQKETNMSVDAKFIPTPAAILEVHDLTFVIQNEVWQVSWLLGRIESGKWAKQLTIWAIGSGVVARR